MTINLRSVSLDEALESPQPGQIVELDLFLTSEQAVRLERLASKEGISLAQFLRRTVHEFLLKSAYENEEQDF